MAFVVIQREAIGRPGIPCRYDRVWLCKYCDWWGVEGPKKHRLSDGSALKHDLDGVYETYVEVRSSVFVRAKDIPPIYYRKS